MPEDIISTSPESTSVDALKVAVFSYTHPTIGPIKVGYEAKVDMPSYVATVTNSAVAASKNHMTIVNTGSRLIRIRKIICSAHITANITGATIMLSLEGIQAPFPITGSTITPRKLNTNFEDIPTGLTVRAAPTDVTVASNYVLAIKPLNIEEAVTTTNNWIELFNKDNEVSSIFLNQNEGIVIRQGTLAGAGALNINAYVTLD